MTKPQDSIESSEPLPAQVARRVQGKVVLIVDGADENGRSLALALAEGGAHLAIVHDGTRELHVIETKRLVEAQGQRCLVIQAPEPSKVVSKQAVEQVWAEFGRLDLFIDNTAPERAAASHDNRPHALIPSLNILVAALTQLTSSPSDR